MDNSVFDISNFTSAALRSSTPVLLVLLGETITQRVGVINLGVEGQMLVGALTGFAFTAITGNPWAGIMIGMLAGMALSAVHGILCLHCKANQIAAGVAVMILGTGLSGFYGIPFVGQKINGLGTLSSGFFSHIPIISQLTPCVLIALILTPLVGLWLYRTRTGLYWRSVGESPDIARNLGISPLAIQWGGILVGGLFSGLAGSALSVDYTQNWIEGMSAGRGLVAVGLVIVARWNPFYALPAALLFGGAESLYLRLQAVGLGVSPYLLSTLPYLIPLIVLLASTRSIRATGGGMPQGLKVVFSS